MPTSTEVAHDKQRPFHILGVAQIAVGALDISPLRHLWIDLFGLSHVNSHRSETENVYEETLKIIGGDNSIEIDLMEPLDADVSPGVHQPALNHIGLWVDDLQSCYDWLQDQGMRFTPGGIREGALGHKVCFIHPKANDAYPLSGEGVLIELVQAPSDMIRTCPVVS